VKWTILVGILEMEAGDFPGVLEELAKLGDSTDDDPFSDDPGAADFVTVATARWYELEGGAVLEWILTEPEILGELKEWVVDYGISLEAPDPFANEIDKLPAERLFIRGMVEAGRGEDARLMLGGEKPELVKILNAEMEKKRVGELEKEGWQAVKGAIGRSEWDQVDKLKSEVPALVWDAGMGRLTQEVIRTHPIYLAGESVTFREINEKKMPVLGRFRLKEQALGEVARGNEEAQCVRLLYWQLGLEGE